MTGRASWIRRRAALLVVAALAVVMFGGTALAGHITSNVKSYTGCLVPGDGVIIKVKEGNAPKSACTGGQTEAHFSGGDISKISVGSGLTLPNGGDNGEVRIELAAGQTLPSGCTAGRVAEWNGSAWECGVDNDTTYSAGLGIDLNESAIAGKSFEIDEPYLTKNDPDCPNGEFATGFNPTGVIQCLSPPTAQGVKAYAGSAGQVEVAGTVTIISKTLPAGKYVITAHVEVNTPRFEGDDSFGYCDISGDRAEFQIPAGEAYNGNATLTGTISQTTTGAVLLTCTETSGNLDVNNASLTAIEVGSIG